MKKIFENEYLTLILRLIVGFVFLSFGLEKIVDPTKFAKEMLNYQILPYFSANIFALILPWIEVISGLLLILGIKIKANSTIISGLLLIFIFAVSLALIRGLDINCGCSSSHPQKVGLPKILENTSMLLMCAVLYFFPSKRFILKDNL